MRTRAWFRIHSFAGVVTGLLLFVICWSGTFAVISKELDWLATPEMRVSPVDTRVTWGAMQQAVEDAYPGANVRWITAPLNRWAAAEVVAVIPDYGGARVYVDPYTGAVRGRTSFFNTRQFFYKVHYNLFLSEFGAYLVAAFAIMLGASLVSALVFYKRWWTRFLRFPSRKGLRWSDLHKLGGLWSLWFVLIIALTGFWYLFERGFGDLGGPLNYVGNPPHGVVQVPTATTEAFPTPLSIDCAIAVANAAWPELNVKVMAHGFYTDRDHLLYLEGQEGFSMLRDRANQIHIDRNTGEILWRNDSSDLPPYWILSNMADPLHFGNFAGIWSKLIWFVFGLVLSGLVLTGTWLHARRLARDPSGGAHHRWPATGAALIATLVLLVASVWFGVHDASNLGLIVEGVRGWPDMAPGAVALIMGWVILTFALIAGWASVLAWPRRFAGSDDRVRVRSVSSEENGS